MLKGIPSILTPDLLKILMEMGHGDELCIGDGNFPSAAYGRRLVRCDGHPVPRLLDAILQFFPLDTFVDAPVALMEVVDPNSPEPEIWAEYERIVKRHAPDAAIIEHVERFNFYERAKKAYAVIATGETALYANIILKKGVVVE
ncbi:MAG: RbsD/FucU family protein, partial [Spirochaetales bacterium]